jgi:3D-(3,5/4)-trihydroxycyclohexane-1,2-dione acylhydrolase (decyclizing)
MINKTRINETSHHEPPGRTDAAGIPAVHVSRLSAMRRRAEAIAAAGNLETALARGTVPRRIDTTLSEGLVLGLLKQGVRKYLAVLGHGSTDLGEVLRVYQEAGVTRTYNFRNEVAMAHAATALRWQYGETAAVVTSIGPGALQAFAGSLAAASNGIGVYHIYGDETTHGEGPNMQAIPKPEQGLYGRLTAIMGESYVLHTPEALRAALRRGSLAVHRPYRAGPFYLLLPINTQPAPIAQLNLLALPDRAMPPATAVADPAALDAAVDLIRHHRRIVIKAGGGARAYPDAVRALVEAVGGVAVLSPAALGVLPHDHPRNMLVGGSKGSISGNYAMANADLLIVVGSRAVCQADCSGTGYPRVEAVININADLGDLLHYNRTVGLAGDIGLVIERLLDRLGQRGGIAAGRVDAWLRETAEQRAAWEAFKAKRYAQPTLVDEVWGGPVLTQPAAIKVAADFARAIGAVKIFDAGDVQANGFQVVEDDRPLETITETGASYMGFAPSALMASALADRPRYPIAFCGDGSFVMNPQVLVDGVAHGVRGIVLILDNRRMAAISALQLAQYGRDFRTHDSVDVDYVRLAASVRGVRALDGGRTPDQLRAALGEARAHPGLAIVHVPVYYGPDPLGGLGTYGAWNVGNWCEAVQARYHEIGL